MALQYFAHIHISMQESLLRVAVSSLVEQTPVNETVLGHVGFYSG